MTLTIATFGVFGLWGIFSPLTAAVVAAAQQVIPRPLHHYDVQMTQPQGATHGIMVFFAVDARQC